ncbi:MAG: metallophosphoesterase family protein [Bacteroidota bacterium]
MKTKTIGLISDTHGWLDPKLWTYLDPCDEVWHAGDVGSKSGILEAVSHRKPLRAVFGNIDGQDIKNQAPLNQVFSINGLKCLITHIGGYPGRYTPRVRQLLDEHRPGLYICGHSHILKVMPDKKRGLLHMNPGACGRHGFHRIRTILRFDISAAGLIEQVQVIELGKRGQ